jgi:hypothetical protein
MGREEIGWCAGEESPADWALEPGLATQDWLPHKDSYRSCAEPPAKARVRMYLTDHAWGRTARKGA